MESRHLPPLLQARQRDALGSVRTTGAPRRPQAAKSRVGSRLRSASATPNVMDFFKGMETGLKEEGQELKEVGKALQDQLRAQRRARSLQRPGSGQRSPTDALQDAREGFYRSASCAALPPQQPRRPGRAEWEVHEEAWERFQEQAPEPLYVEAVPWPPCSEDILDFYEQVHSLGDLRKAYRLACRRWHPDKFLQKYGSTVPPEELAYMTFRVNEVFQAITAQWDRYQVTHR
mmetsp:Transcript_116940/g.342460  ORF Transcript_116940/g.342460 Transcript_116940/m.342460 type:complete len:232 (-) Transcript_116940:104-799(-)